eukprot:TRINITY_DN11176_c0_g1_i1.p1 TRINITY_DN11176_c0_g1~~TRINITY_DN11176_c0_g1_i1.p1  ORF type:complete len:758 (-),score=148.28 TRINITY_DN11176_c0_g1_i1:423-2696(-)
MDESQYVNERRLVSESFFVMEAMVLLHGCSGRIWRVDVSDHGTVRVTKNLEPTLSHVSQESTNSLSKKLESFAVVVTSLKYFENKVFARAWSVMSQTVEALANYCQQVRTSFMNELKVLYQSLLPHTQQGDISAERRNPTLLNLLQFLRPYATKFQSIYELAALSIVPAEQVENRAALSAAKVLTQSYHLFHQASMVKNKDMFLFHAKLFFAIQKPYVDMMRRWMVDGRLLDPHDEFFVECKSTSSVIEESTDEQAFMALHALRMTGQDSSRSVALPAYLVDQANAILSIGRSSYILSKLDKEYIQASWKEFFFNQQDTKDEPKIEALICEDVNKDSIPDHEMKRMSLEQTDANSAFHPTSILTMDLQPGFHRPSYFVSQSQEGWCEEETLKEKTNPMEDLHMRQIEESMLQSIEEDKFFVPISHFISDAFIKPWLQRFSMREQRLAQVLLEKYKIQDYFRLLRDYSLLARGDVISVYLSLVFNVMKDSSLMVSTIELNEIFQQSHSYVTTPENVKPVLLDARQGIKDGNVLDLLGFAYKVDPPNNIVITTEALEVYGRLFNFLVQVKYAKYVLESIRLSRGSRSPSTDAQPLRVQVLRMKILNFVSNLHNHLMIRVLHSSWSQFVDALEKVKSLDDIHRSHSSYLSQLMERCMLNQNQSRILEVIKRMLSLAVKLFSLTRPTHPVAREQGSDIIRETDEVILRKIEDEFHQCARFLIVVLSSKTKPGTHPHLDDLLIRLDFNSYYQGLMQNDGRVY